MSMKDERKYQKDLIQRKIAREDPESELKDWIASGGKTYYIAHQMALNPLSKTTSVEVVLNSSQAFNQYRLHASWDLGPDIMSNFLECY